MIERGEPEVVDGDARVTLTNTGDRAGVEVVQLYPPRRRSALSPALRTSGASLRSAPAPGSETGVGVGAGTI